MVDVRANLEIFLAVVVLGFSALQSIVALVSFSRLKNKRAAFIGLGFAAFAVEGAYLTYTSWQTRGTQEWVMWIAVLDVIVLLLLYLAIRGR